MRPRSLTSGAEWLMTPLPLTRGNGKVLIVGMPKSGTTAIAQLFGSCANLNVCSDPLHELDKRGVQFRSELFSGGLPLDRLWRRYRFAFSGEVVKDPNFPLLLDQLVGLKPYATFIFLVRDPRRNIRSILNRLKVPGHLSEVDCESLSLPRTWASVLNGSTPDMPGDNYVERLAWRWRTSAEAYLRHREKCIPVRYEDFNASKVAYIDDLVRRCGYTPQKSIEHLVDMQFQPKGHTSTSDVDFFGSQNLAAIHRITGPLLDEFSYPRQ